MIITKDFSSYEPWSGAIDTFNSLVDLIGFERIEEVLEENMYDGSSETDINDLFWHEDNETLADMFGVYWDEKNGEFTDDEDEDGDDEE